MVNYTSQYLGIDKAAAEQYVSTYDGMKIVSASLTPVLGTAAASKLGTLFSETSLVKEATINPAVVQLYGPLGNPNDPRAPASTFRSGTYTEKTAKTNMYFYRDYGGSAKADGRFWTPEPSKGSLQSQMDSAVLPEWGNTFKNQAIMKIPKGTTYYEDSAAAQTGTQGTKPMLHGGGTQVFLPSPQKTGLLKNECKRTN